MKKHIINLLITLALLTGVALMMYPFLADWYNQLHREQVIRNYSEHVAGLSRAELAQERSRARGYNEGLLDSVEPGDPFRENINQTTSGLYRSILNIGGEGMMGYIRIPRIAVKLPIYHGTGEDAMRKGVGHLEQSSFPIGGEATHTVLAAHSGSPAAELFTNLNQLEEGDLFYLEGLGETLAYRVDQIKVVEPADIESLKIVSSKDYATLITCTPYGINSHRLLVRGERTEYIEEREQDFAGQNVVRSKRYIIMIVCLCLVAAGIIGFMIVRKKVRVKFL